MEKQLACVPEAGDILDNMIPQSSGSGKVTTKAPTVPKTWRYTSIASLEDGPQTRHRREADVATPSEADATWSSTYRSTSVDEEIEALEETARRDGVLVEDSDVDMMMADERTIENFVVDSTPTSEATDTEIDVIETVNSISESATPNTVSTEPEKDQVITTSEAQISSQFNAPLQPDQRGIKPPMVHARSDSKSMDWVSTEADDHTAEMKLLGHLPKGHIVVDNKQPHTTPIDESASASSAVNLEMASETTENAASSTTTSQNILPIDTDIVLLKESSYSIVKNGTVIDVLELNDTISEEEKTTSDNVVIAPIVSDKEIEDNMILNDDEEKPLNVQKQDKKKISEHKVVELTFTEPSVFSSSFVITTKNFKEPTNAPSIQTKTQTQEIDPKIEILNSNDSKVNTDSELLFENKSAPFITTDASKEAATSEASKKTEDLSPTPNDTEKETVEFQEADIEPSEEMDSEPEQLHRPNRRRLLTQPKARGGYPFHIRRVLG